MIVTITAEAVAMEEADVFTALAVRSTLEDDALREAVAAQHLGVVDDDGAHVWLVPSVLLEAAADEARVTGVAGMIGYAASKGWVDAEGRVRAHVDRAGQ